MKRILVPIALLQSEEERIVGILRSMGRERVEFRGFSPESEAEVRPPHGTHSETRIDSRGLTCPHPTMESTYRSRGDVIRQRLPKPLLGLTLS
jgi:hypothetical protein